MLTAWERAGLGAKCSSKRWKESSRAELGSWVQAKENDAISGQRVVSAPHRSPGVTWERLEQMDVETQAARGDHQATGSGPRGRLAVPKTGEQARRCLGPEEPEVFFMK